jgi:hypothetical protein
MKASEENDMKNQSNNNVAIVKTGGYSYEIVLDGETIELRFTDLKPSKPFTFATTAFRRGRAVYSFSGVLPETEEGVVELVRREADMIRETVLSGRSFDPSREIAKSLRF